MEPAGQRASALKLWIRRLLPWLVTAVVVGVLLSRYSITKIAAAMQSGDAWMLAPWALGASVVSLLFMSTADWLLFRAALGPLRWSQVVAGRGGTSLVTAANYGAGQGSYGLWVARVTGAGAGRTTGVIAYLMLSDLTSVCLVAAASLWITGLSVAEELRGLALGLAPLIAAGLVLVALLGPRLLPLLEQKIALLKRVSALTAPWRSVSPVIYLQSLSLRGIYVLVSALFWYLAARSMQLDAPLSAFLTFLPLIYLVGSLPINVGPFGVVQVAWLHFFSAYAPEERILGLQVVFGALLAMGFALRALPFVAKVVREIEAGAAPAHREQDDKEQLP